MNDKSDLSKYLNQQIRDKSTLSSTSSINNKSMSERPDSFLSSLTESSIERRPSTPKIVSHVIIKEYYGKQRRISQNIYIEEKQNKETIIHDNIKGNIDPFTLTNNSIYNNQSESREQEQEQESNCISNVILSNTFTIIDNNVTFNSENINTKELLNKSVKHATIIINDEKSKVKNKPKNNDSIVNTVTLFGGAFVGTLLGLYLNSE